MNYYTKINDISHESGGISIPKRIYLKRSAIAIATALIIMLGVTVLSLVGCPDNTGSDTDTVIDTTAPARVTGFADMRSEDLASVTLSWTNPADTDLQTILITVTPVLSDLPLYVPANGASMEQSEVVMGLDVDKDYVFAVRTVDATGNESASSDAPTVVVRPDAIPPGQLTELTQVRSLDGTSVTLSWTNPADADLASVRIMAAPTILGFPLNIAADGASTSQSRMVTGLAATTEYTFTARTVDLKNNVSASSGAPTVIVPPDTTAPGQVTGVTAVPVGTGNTVTLSWTNPTDADLSHASISWTPTSSGPSQSIETAKDATTQLVQGLAVSTPHTFTVRAVDLVGNESDSSGASTADATTGADVVTLAFTNDAHTFDTTFTVGVPMSVTLPASLGGLGPLRYTLDIRLSSATDFQSTDSVIGLAFNGMTRVLSGTPTAVFTTGGSVSVRYLVRDATDSFSVANPGITVLAQ